ncbi:ABC transporter permease [Rhodococcus sp. HNM0569]|uniref:ABC transporter permease n=1 Tax=Rhodococcus sp. HNM0569 TaxID=2716340 RepID=UPI00146D3CB2|nr:ABC transporter permease [Rhodococcus sp. HNM0569]NLU82460.1 ABC transporter permease [Rhodococcus sp. HNM0569]
MSAPLSNTRAIGLVARREFQTQVAKKSFVISNVLVLLAIVGGIVATSIFSGGDDNEAQRVGVVGAPALTQVLAATGDALGVPVEVSAPADGAAARGAVESGDVDAAVLVAPDGDVTVMSQDSLGSDLSMVVDAAVRQQAQNQALAAEGVDPATVAAAIDSVSIRSDVLDPPDPEQGQRVALSIAVVVVLYMQILGFGMYVAMGVVEEKSSRVVELLLSTVRPLQLLWGKVIGIGLVGLMQLVMYGIAGVGAALATGVLTITGTAVSVFASTIGWFVLGFAFFAVLYAAAGSMVSRQEDVNSTAMPLMIVILAMFFSAFTAVDNPDGTLSNVLSWIPPFSAIMMPLRIAAGVASPAQIVGTIVLMLAVTIALSWVAARIYQRSILRIGKVVSWREALGAGSRA